ncbi:hypothetical protein Acr_00g0014580 [Actinidia rufa]|uniref:Protein kinase domain-containing protein n=1 Tax=Actinidia rufa TaxID=165716 RepID=A0A7J0DAH3_9ERIC|nr:hypothetical protein Acr_00g0014580 [Actinidia rufa]
MSLGKSFTGCGLAGTTVPQDDNDELRRSPGTPVFTAPECCLGLTYRGNAADTWAVGVTLYCLVFGKYPFLGDTLQDTYDKHNYYRFQHLNFHWSYHMDPLLKNLLEGLLCKDPRDRMTLGAVAEHAWVIGEEGPIPQYLCWCKRKRLEREGYRGSSQVNQEYYVLLGALEARNTIGYTLNAAYTRNRSVNVDIQLSGVMKQSASLGVGHGILCPPNSLTPLFQCTVVARDLHPL